MEISPDQVPAGWTNDPAYPESFFRPGSEETLFARCHGLDVFKVILSRAPNTGELGYILHSDDNYYWGDLMIDHIFKITKPTSLPDILRVLAIKGDGALKMKELKRVRDYQDVEREERGERGAQEELRKDEPIQKHLFKPVG